MKIVNRRTLKGSKLGLECMNAIISHDDYGGVRFCCCYGKYDASDDEPLDICKKCGAWDRNFDYEKADKILKELKN